MTNPIYNLKLLSHCIDASILDNTVMICKEIIYSIAIKIHKTYCFFITDLGIEWRYLLYPSLSIWADDKKRTCPPIRDLLTTTAPVPDWTVSMCKTSAPQHRRRKERPVTPMFRVQLCVKTQLHLYWLLMCEAHFWLLYMELLGIRVLNK